MWYLKVAMSNSEKPFWGSPPSRRVASRNIPPLPAIFVILAAAVQAGELPAPAPGEAGSFRVTVRVGGEALNAVRPLIFGDNIEWTHHGMGLWRAGEKDLDEELVNELRAAGVTHLRYPGGTLSDYFRWSSAVGEERKPIPNPFDAGKTQYPTFGPAEFMALCRRLGIPGTITLNAGTGTPEEAAGWVKYFREQGFPVTAFAIGNEIHMAGKGEPIHKTPEEYADFFLRAKEAIERVAPGTKLGAIGLHDTGMFPLSKHPDWMEKVLGRIGGRIDFLDIHSGYAPAIRSPGPDPRTETYGDDDFARCFLAAPVYVERNIAATKADLERLVPGGGGKIEIHMTEYGPLVYPTAKDRAMDDASWNRSLAGALYQACLFNVLLREPRIASANHLPLCQDVFGALIGIRGGPGGRKIWRNSVFHVFRMYAAMAGRDACACEVRSPAFSTRAMGIVPSLADVSLVDAGAYRSRDGKEMALFLINRDLKREASVDVRPGFARFAVESITTLAAPSYRAENGPEGKGTVAPAARKGPGEIAAESFAVVLSKHSLTVIEFRSAGEGRAFFKNFLKSFRALNSWR